MNGEVINTKRRSDWKTKVTETAPLATSLLVISATYLLVGVTQEDYRSATVGVFAAIAFVSLPAIMFVAGRLRASDFRLLKSWFLLFPVLGWLIGKFLLTPWVKAVFLPWIMAIF